MSILSYNLQISMFFNAVICLLCLSCLSKDKIAPANAYLCKHNTTQYENAWSNGWQRADLNKQCGGWMYLQLHYEVQVVWALVDILQSYNILMLYPGEQEQRIHFTCCQLARATNEVQLAFYFVKWRPVKWQQSVLSFLLQHSACMCARSRLPMNLGKCMLLTR